MMLRRFLYPMHADPRDFGLYPWLEVLREHGRPFRCACCGVAQPRYRPSVFVPDFMARPGEWWQGGWIFHNGRAAMRSMFRRGTVSSWCVSCAWKLCGRQMVTRRQWWRFCA